MKVTNTSPGALVTLRLPLATADGGGLCQVVCLACLWLPARLVSASWHSTVAQFVIESQCAQCHCESVADCGAHL